MEPGAHLRTIRRARGQTLKDIAQKAGFTQAYLSQVETGRTTPSLASLKRIATAYAVSLAELFAEQPDDHHDIVLRRADRRKLVLGSGDVVKELLVARQSGKRMEPIHITIRPGAGSDGLYDHAGEEFGLVISGQLELTVEDTVHQLRSGDSFYFASTHSHGFRNPSSRHLATVLWVITPPSM